MIANLIQLSLRHKLLIVLGFVTVSVAGVFSLSKLPIDAFPDIKVQKVTSFPDKPGRWQFVDAFPDFTIQIVDAFPDFTVKYVDAFPGCD